MPATPAAPPARVLVVEDEDAINDVVTTALRFHGHAVTSTDRGDAGLRVASSGDFDLIVFDVMLPGLDGFEVCRRLREQGVATPVLFLSARDQPADRIRGFTTGADDYLTKPFSVDELVLRVAAILRRSAPEPSNVLCVGEIELLVDAQEVRRGGERVELSSTEFRLLEHLMINAGIVRSKQQLLDHVWDVDFDGSENVVELYVGYLRKKLGDHDHELIRTRRGAGYVLVRG